ncbi:MAG: hypothetical protein HC796_04355 [Synechococcaceae cyanobacterium RL_1_2]|nr:hypothetical protein [Synechococcaceae cyanobacterium RL_1_2]
MRPHVFKLAALTLTISTLGLINPAYANTSNGGGYQSSESDTFSGPDGLNPFDLIHQAQRGDVRSMGEFTADAQTNIRNASLDFRAQQQLLILQMLQQKKTGETQSPTAVMAPQEETNSVVVMDETTAITNATPGIETADNADNVELSP